MLDLLFSNLNPFEVSIPREVLTLPASQTYALEAATVAMSFEADDLDGTQGLFSRDAKNDGGDGYHVSLYIKKGELIARFQNADREVFLRAGEVEAGTTYHTAITFGDDEVSLFLDGALISSKAFDFTWETSPEQMQFGALGWKSASGDAAVSNIFDGALSNISLYDAVLSEDAIAALAATVAVADPVDAAPDIGAQAPVIEDPAIETPVEEDPIVEEPVIVEEPIADDPVIEEPEEAEDTSEIQEPVAEEPEAPEEIEQPEEPEENEHPEAPEEIEQPEPETPAAPRPDPIASEGETENGNVITLGNGTEVMTGRTSTLEHDGEDIASIRVLNKPDMGNLTVNPDNTLALVLSMTNATGNISFSYEVTYDDGSSETVNQSIKVVKGTQAKGWAEGDFYELEEGDDGAYIVEHGDNHRKVFISGDEDALSVRDIAALEDISPDKINIEWMAENPEYGAAGGGSRYDDVARDHA